MNSIFKIALLTVICIICQSCRTYFSTEIAVRPGAKNINVGQFETSWHEYYLQRENSVLKISDTSFIMILKTSSEDSLRATYYGKKLDTIWTSAFKANNKEQAPFIWGRTKKTINALSQITEYPSTRFINREVSIENGKLIREEVIFEEKFSDFNYDRVYFFSNSPDSSKLLITALPYFDQSGETPRFILNLTVVSNDFKMIQTRKIEVYVDEDHNRFNPPDFFVNNRGDIFYPSYHLDGSNIIQHLIKLPFDGTPADSLKTTFPAIQAGRGSYALPTDSRIHFQNDGTLLLAWQHQYRDDTKGVTLTKYNVAERKAEFSNMVNLEDNIFKTLKDFDGFPLYKLVYATNLPNGESAFLLQMKTNNDGRLVKFVATAGVRAVFEAGPIIACKVNSLGKIMWANSTRETDTRSARNFVSSFLKDTSIRFVYNSSSEDGAAYREFSLKDGSSFSAELPFTYAPHAAFLPALTIWNNDNSAIFFGITTGYGMIMRTPLPLTQPFKKKETE